MVPYCDVGSFVRSLVGSFVLFALRFALDVRDLLPPLLFSLSSLLADVFMSESLVLQNEIPKFCKTRTTTLRQGEMSGTQHKIVNKKPMKHNILFVQKHSIK